MSNSLVALSSAVVLAVYSAGYLRTQAAADRFATEADQRRPAPGPLAAATPITPQAPASAPAETAIVAPSGAAAPHTTPATAAPPRAPGTPSPSVAAVAPVATAARLNGQTEAVGPVAVAPITAPVVVASPDPTVVPVSSTALTPTPSAPAGPVKPRYKDGTFTGWGTSRHGDIQAQVIVADGRITSATIAQCMTRWPCSWIEALPGQVVTRQSPETDYVSGATQSTNAFYYAVVQALGKAVAE
jgi:uncharacterized protein with FMN-binding domain